MTTIAYKDGVLAADRLCVDAYNFKIDVSKVAIFNDGKMAVATAGRYDEGIRFFRYVENFGKEVSSVCSHDGIVTSFITDMKKNQIEFLQENYPFWEADEPTTNDYLVLLLQDDGSIKTFVRSGKIFVEIHEPMIVFGTGGKIALGAMAAYCGAEQAIRYAAQYDANTSARHDKVEVVGGQFVVTTHDY